MARELSFVAQTGLTLFATCWEILSTGAESGKVLDVAGGAGLFETPGATMDDYDIALTEDGSTGHYAASLQTGMSVGTPYIIRIHERAAATPAWSTDGPPIGQGLIGVPDANAAMLSRDSTAADNLEAMTDGTGGVDLTLKRLRLVAASGQYAVDVTGASDTEAVRIYGQAASNGSALWLHSAYGQALKMTATADAAVLASGAMAALDLAATGGGSTVVKTTAASSTLSSGIKADINAEVDSALDTAIPGSPTANSINERVKTLDDADVPGRLPAALVSGRMDSSVGAMAAAVLTATAIASDAITDAKVASDVTIASVTGSVGSVVGNVGGNVVGSVASVTGNVGGNVTGSVGSLAAQAQTDVGTAVKAATSDGVTLETIFKRLNSMARGKIVKTGDNYAFKAEDGTTTLFTLTIASGERTTA